MPTIIKYERSKITNIRNDEFLKLIEYWWIELSDRGEPVRELGFDASDEIVYAARAGKDNGLWIDSGMYFENPDDFGPVTQMAFELKWNLFEKEADG